MIASLQMFGFRALWSPFFLLFLLCIAVMYMLIVGPWHHKFTKEGPATPKQKAYFLTGIVLLYLCKGSPLDLLSHLMFSAHMIQMAILYLMIPQCFILGIPNWLYERMLEVRAVKGIFLFFTKPFVALLLFNGLFSFYHVPLIFDFLNTNALYHAVVTIAIFIVAFFMWWPLVNKLPQWQTLSGLRKVGFIFADGVLLTPACALIIFANSPLYQTFTDPQAWLTSLQLCVPKGTLASLNLTGPQMFLSMPPLYDQQLGGVLMKIIQEIVYGTMLFFIFIDWYRKEREKESVETIISPQPGK